MIYIICSVYKGDPWITSKDFSRSKWINCGMSGLIYDLKDQTLKYYNLSCYPLIIINNLFIESSLISAYALFYLRALFGAIQIHS